MSIFQHKVLKIVSKIPKGKVMTYKEVAILSGRPKAYRSVGNILNRNFLQNGPKIPCHRVIKSNGEIGNYALGKIKKEKLLKKEDIEVINHKIDLEKYLKRE